MAIEEEDDESRSSVFTPVNIKKTNVFDPNAYLDSGS